MKKALFICMLLLTVSNSVVSQEISPVSWESSSEKINDNEYYLLFTATIKTGWHLYNLQIPEGGPIATSFTFDKTKSVKFLGKVFSEDSPIISYDKSFNMELEYFSNKVIFKQKIKINKGKSTKVLGNIRFMCCDDHQCIPPAVHKFEILIK